ncbi:MAG TPA: VOC family protein [Caulobacteraceae bacterium]|jgi:uncharacterized glyoxalase superfamily protein PhnB|nr:VOC family protein [Caulobacteraceae bacterium]
MAEQAARQQTEAPQTLGTLTPYLTVSDAKAAGDFYAKAFGAVEVNRMVGAPDGRLIHLHLHLNGASLMMSDPFPEHGHGFKEIQGMSLVLQVEDADTWWGRAVAAGCEVVMPLQLMFWGDRYGQLKDPFGVLWAMNEAAAKA